MSVSIAQELIKFDDLETEVAEMKEASRTKSQDDNRGRAVNRKKSHLSR